MSAYANTLAAALFDKKLDHVVFDYGAFCDPHVMRVLSAITSDNTRLNTLTCCRGASRPVDEEQRYWELIGRVFTLVASIERATFVIARYRREPRDAEEYSPFSTIARALEKRSRLGTIIITGASLMDFVPLVQSRGACPRKLRCINLYDCGSVGETIMLHAVRDT
jgi:hypothetical protein